MARQDTRHLQKRGNKWSYVRRVPGDMTADSRFPRVVVALHTDSLITAQRLRNDLAARDDALWAAMRQLQKGSRTPEAFALLFAELGVSTMPKYPDIAPAKTIGGDILDEKRRAIGEELVAAVDRIKDQITEAYSAGERDLGKIMEGVDKFNLDAVIDKVMGDRPELARFYKQQVDRMTEVSSHFTEGSPLAISAPLVATGQDSRVTVTDTLKRKTARSVLLSEALEVWRKMNGKRLAGKSADQLRKTQNPVKRAINRFCNAIGDMDVLDINRDLAVEFYDYHDSLINLPEGSDDKPLKPSSAKRDFQELRGIWNAVAKRSDVDTRDNPFAGLVFHEGASDRKPYSVEWIKSKWLQPGAFDGLNDQAFAILMVLVETGARMSEICSLRPEDIQLDSNVPHLLIQPFDDGENKRQLKNKASRRPVPLTGIALEIMHRHRNGFPRYFDNAGTFSAATSKFIRENDLREEGRVLHSLRHTYIDRLRNGKVPEDLRKAIVGHAADGAHGGYGNGFDLDARQEAMAKIALPFDPEIV
jgi:integrase